MVNRGPQLVQLMNGYACRRSAGSRSSARQSSHMALSADTRAVRRAPGALGAIENPALPYGCICSETTWSTRASGGASRRTANRNSATAAREPSTSANTPSESLPTKPDRPSRAASAWTNGRNPTPCTVPVTRTETRVTSLLTVPVWRGRALSSQTMTTHAAIGYELRQRGGLRVLAWPALDRYPVDALVTTRHGGVSTGDYATLNLSFGVGDRPEHVLENRRRAATSLGADLGDFVLGSQVHGAVARVVTRADRGRGAAVAGAGVGEADALVTGDPGTVLGAVVADCVPMLLYDPGAQVIACVHAGWRGTVARVSGAALAAMATLGTKPRDVIAGIGPAIGPDRYQVGEEVAQAVHECFGERASLVIRPDGTGRWLCDLWSANRLLLREAGVPGDQIHVAAVPTGTDFFSNRMARPCGRFGVLARLRPRDGGAA